MLLCPTHKTTKAIFVATLFLWGRLIQSWTQFRDTTMDHQWSGRGRFTEARAGDFGTDCHRQGTGNEGNCCGRSPKADCDNKTLALLMATIKGTTNRRTLADVASRTTNGVRNGCVDDCSVLRNSFICRRWCISANPWLESMVSFELLHECTFTLFGFKMWWSENGGQWIRRKLHAGNLRRRWTVVAVARN
jgi:hypothetical protein